MGTSKFVIKIIERLPKKYQNIAIELYVHSSIHYTTIFVNFIAFAILNTIVFLIGLLFFQMSFLKVLGAILFNSAWMSFILPKIKKKIFNLFR